MGLKNTKCATLCRKKNTKVTYSNNESKGLIYEG